MDEVDTYGPEPMGPPEPIPFTQADSLRLQRLSQARSTVQNQVADGTLHPAEGDEMALGIAEQMKPLQARMEQTKGLAKQKVRREALEEMAIAKAVQQADGEADAAGFARRIAAFTDPLTGETAYFAPPGYERIDSGGAEGDGEGRMTAYVPPSEQAPLPGQHTMTITTDEGTRRTGEATFDLQGGGKYRTTSDQRFDRPPAEPQQAERGTLLPSEAAAIQQAAVQNVGRFMRPGTPRFESAVREEAHMLKSRLLQSREAQAREAASAQRAEANEGRLKERQQQKEEAVKQRQDDHKDLDRIFDSISKDKDFEGKSRGERMKAAKAEWEERHGRKWGGESTVNVDSRAGTPEAKADPAKPLPLPEQQANRFDELTKHFSSEKRKDLTVEQRSLALGAVASLKALVDKYGGDIRTAPPDVQERARAFAERIKAMGRPIGQATAADSAEDRRGADIMQSMQ